MKKKVKSVPYADIMARAEQRGTLKEIARDLGISVSTVSAARRAWKKSGRRSPPAKSQPREQSEETEVDRLRRMNRCLNDAMVRILMEVAR